MHSERVSNKWMLVSESHYEASVHMAPKTLSCHDDVVGGDDVGSGGCGLWWW